MVPSSNWSTSLSQAGLSTASHWDVILTSQAAKNLEREKHGEPGSLTTGGTCNVEMNKLKKSTM